MHLQEKTTASNRTYEGKIFYITKDTAELEDGRQVQRDVVHHSGGVCVVPLTERGTVLMVKQFRYPMQQVTLEIPAGKIEPGEDPAECGRRELQEEAGRTCKQYTSLGTLFPTPAYDTEVIHMYLAQELSAPGAQNLDDGEFLDVTEIPLEEAVQLVMDGKIPDAKTQIALLKTYVLLQRSSNRFRQPDIKKSRSNATLSLFGFSRENSDCSRMCFRFRSGFCLLFCFHQRQVLLVLFQNLCFHHLSGSGRYGMYNITEYTVFILSAGHCHKQACVSLYNLDIMYRKHIVNGNRNNCTQPSLCNNPSNFNICDFHKMTSSIWVTCPSVYMDTYF